MKTYMKTPMTDRFLCILNKGEEDTKELVQKLHDELEIEFPELDEEELCEYVLNDAGLLY
jgi:hypothetical protein